MLILSEVVRASWLGVKSGGKDLGDIGAEAGVGLRNRLLLVAGFGGPLADGNGRVESGGGVLWTQVFTGDGDAGLVVDEDLVMRGSSIGWRADDVDAVAL